MEQLIELLKRIPSSGLGTVVHVGADSATLDAYGQLPIGRLVLIDGDADTVNELRLRAPGDAQMLEIVAQAVAATAGPMRWHRYNLRTLNGPLEAAGLGPYYPRLRLLHTEPLQALALPDLLHSLALAPHPANVLVLDVPGQEALLLDSLAPALLRGFGWLAIRGCGAAQHGHRTPLDRATGALAQRHYRMVGAAEDSDVLWPCALYGFDSAAHEQVLLQLRIESMQSQVDTLQRQAADNESHLAQARDAAAALQSRLAATDGTLAATLLQLTEEQSQRAAFAADLAAARAALLNAEAERNSLAGALQAESVRRSEIEAALGALRHQHDALLADAHEAGTRSAALASQALHQEQLLQEQVAALAAEKSALQAAAETNLHTLSALQAECTRLGGLVRDQEASLAALSAATKAMAHEESAWAADKKRLEQQLQEQTAANAALQAAKTGSDAAAAAHAAQIDVLTRERDAQARQHETALHVAGREARDKTARLEQEVTQLRLRQRLLDDEMIKTEGQLELIKDVLLREPRL